MKVSDDALKEFIMLWEQTYGEEIEVEKARKYAHQLLKLLKAIYDID